MNGRIAYRYGVFSITVSDSTGLATRFSDRKPRRLRKTRLIRLSARNGRCQQRYRHQHNSRMMVLVKKVSRNHWRSIETTDATRSFQGRRRPGGLPSGLFCAWVRPLGFPGSRASCGTATPVGRARRQWRKVGVRRTTFFLLNFLGKGGGFFWFLTPFFQNLLHSPPLSRLRSAKWP